RNVTGVQKCALPILKRKHCLILKGATDMDKIILKDMLFYGFHGLFPEENKLGQRFRVDLVLYLDLQKAGKSDNMEDSIDYGQVRSEERRVGKECMCV